jgi:hypothetical protein
MMEIESQCLPRISPPLQFEIGFGYSPGILTSHFWDRREYDPLLNAGIYGFRCTKAHSMVVGNSWAN